ncbi:MAG: hypothetical protein WA618_18500 [Terriglobales bacterium]
MNLPDNNQNPPLKPLHPDSLLIRLKLVGMETGTTEELIRSLTPGQKDCLKVRRDGTILDGHHRLYILRKRGVNVDELPRDIIEKE